MKDVLANKTQTDVYADYFTGILHRGQIYKFLC